jgi:hypothetical protein
MFELLKLQLSHLFRPVTSIQRRAKGKAIHAYEELEAAPLQRKRLLEPASRGDVDAVEKEFKAYLATMEKACRQVESVEGDEILVEFRAEKGLNRIAATIAKLKQILTKVDTKTPEERQTLNKLIKEAYLLDSYFKETVGKAYNEIQQQYTVLNRESKMQEESIQIATFHLAPVMQTMRKLYLTRSEQRAEVRSQGQFVREARELLEDLHQLSRTPPEQHPALLKKILAADEHVEAAFKAFKQGLDELVEDYTLIMKTAVQIYFLLRKEESEFIGKFLDQIIKTGFPEKDSAALKELEQKMLEHLDKEAVKLADATARARQQLRQAA